MNEQNKSIWRGEIDPSIEDATNPVCDPRYIPEYPKEEVGWLIEREGPQWLCIHNQAFSNQVPDRIFWSSDSLKALRFSRKQDGEAMASFLRLFHEHHGCCVTEHKWGL